MKDEFAGRKTACPKCSQQIRVPAIARGQGADDQAYHELPLSELPIVVSSYIQQNLMPGEHLVPLSRVHPMVLVAPAVLTCIGLLVGAVGAPFGEAGILALIMGILSALFGAVAVLVLWLQRLSTEFSCTDRRILIKAGLVTTWLREMPLAKVEALSMVQGLFGKLFGYGTLVFKGSGGTRRSCDSMEHPFDFYKRVQEQVAAAQGRK